MSEAQNDLLRILDATFGEQIADLRATLTQHATDRYAMRDVRTISKIVVHHSDTPATTKWTSIAGYHVNDKDHNWPGIGYHFGVEASGRVVYVGDVETIRYHARQANTASIGVCCLGDYQKTAPSAAMLDSLRRLIGVLDSWKMRWTGKRIMSVTGHRDECDTTCPGDALYAALGDLEDGMEPVYDLKAMSWDPDLDAVRVEANLVRGLKCGKWTPQDLVDGEVYYQIVNAAFIDEEAARGRHVISVDVIDETGNRIQGARVWHGWPTQRYPEYDERVEMTIFGSQIAEWGLYANFDAWTVPGPYWVMCADGKSDVFWGGGLPWNKHVCFAVVFQRTVYRAEPAGTLAEKLLAEGERRQVIQFNPDAALQKRIFAAGFVPNSPEYQVDDGGVYVGQRAEHLETGEVRIYYALQDDWSNVQFVTKPVAT